MAVAKACQLCYYKGMVIQQLLGPNGLMHSVEDDCGTVTIFWAGTAYYFFHRDNAFAKKLGIALLAGLGVLQKTICEFFHVSRHTIANIKNVYEEKGIDGLRNYKQGPADTSEELKSFIIKRYIELDRSRGFQQEILDSIEKKVEAGDFKKTISRGTLQSILRAYRSKLESQKKKNLEKLKATATESGKENSEDEPIKESRAETTDVDVVDDGQLGLIEALSEGEERCVDHGGCSLTVPLLAGYGMANYVPSGETGAQFSNTELATTYAMLNAGEIVKVEQDFKLLAHHEMGGMIGREKLPSLSLYRNRIPLIVAQMEMEDIMLQTSKSMHEILQFSTVVYIDGHFMPYHGGSETLFGYYPQKRLAMHGREYFFVHDRNGLPVYAAISDGYHKSKHYIEYVDGKLREIYEVEKKELLEVFDRGGYSKQFCIDIHSTIRFICWRSDARQMPIEIQTVEWTEVRIEHQGNDYGQIKEKTFYAWERTTQFEGENQRKVIFREIWIKKGNKVSPALTNDFETSLEDLVRHLTRRWGVQENMFKELKDHGIDRIHSYRKEEFSEELLYELGLENREEGIIHEIDNPDRRLINKKISALRAEKRKLAVKLVELQKSGQTKKLIPIQERYTQIEKEIDNQIEQREAMPKKVNLFERIETNGIVRLCDDKKLFFDWLKMNAIWAKRQMVEIVKPIYNDLRDVNKFVKSILKSRTYVRRNGEILHVTFPPQQSKRSAEALDLLCETLNRYDNRDTGLRSTKLVFSVREKH